MTEEMSKKKTDGNAPLQATGGFKMTFPKPENFNLAIFSMEYVDSIFTLAARQFLAYCGRCEGRKGCGNLGEKIP